jgi:hypothetical protein
MRKLAFVFGLLLGLSWLSNAQQRISVEFGHPILIDDFNENSGQWPMITTTENYYVVDKGEYFLNRNNPNSPFIILPFKKEAVSSFHLKTAIKIGPSEGKMPSAGIIFMVQDSGNSAMVMEFNRNKRFRVYNIVGGQPQYLTGDIPSEGWIRNNSLLTTEDYNTLEVKSLDGDFDIFINGILAASFFNRRFDGGKFGLFIGAGTKARVDYFYAYTLPPDEEKIETEALLNRIAELEKENELLRLELEANLDKRLAELKGVVKLLEESLEDATRENMFLKEELRRFEDLRFLVGNIDRGLITTLTSNLKRELTENDRLSKENIQLKDSLNFVWQEFRAFQMDVLEKIEKGKYLIEEPKYYKQTPENTSPEQEGEKKDAPPPNETEIRNPKKRP